MYRLLTKNEIAQLKLQGNRAQDWNTLFVEDPFETEQIRNNHFVGTVHIGIVTHAMVDDGEGLSLPEGIADCCLVDSTVGSHCALHRVLYMSQYHVGDHCLLFNIGQMCGVEQLKWLEPMNENGARRILPFPGMTIGDAYLWTRYRGHSKMLQQLETMAREQLSDGRQATIGDYAVVSNTQLMYNVSIMSSQQSPSSMKQCIRVTDGVVGYGCQLSDGIIAARFLLGENVRLEYGLRLNDTVVGDNSTLARGEVSNSFIFPCHEQHHNSSFLIAALVEGQSNLASGATVGSNHNSRTADGELQAARGFWPGLCCSLKHNSRFAAYCLLTKGDYPNELDIPFPFALVNNNVAKDQLEVMPAYWWMYNMYALSRCNTKFHARDRRTVKAQYIDYQILSPDTAEQILHARTLLDKWMNQAGEDGVVYGEGMEHSKRPVVILKAREAYKAYGDMLYFYVTGVLRMLDKLPQAEAGDEHWVNMGGMLTKNCDVESLITQIEEGSLRSWDDIHDHWHLLQGRHRDNVAAHAMKVLLKLEGKNCITEKEWKLIVPRYEEIMDYLQQQVRATRQKDIDNPFRHITYFDEEEYRAVLGE